MTGQEYIQRQINLVKQQIKGSKVKFTITDAVTKFQYDLYENELQTLESIEKSLKALEIIKEKRVNADLFWNDFVDNRFGYHYYLEKWYKYQSTDKQKITEEEFNLLKEVLG